MIHPPGNPYEHCHREHAAMENYSRRAQVWSQWHFVVLLFCLAVAVPAPAQELTATFNAEKSTYILGEPVWFSFKVSNKGRVPLFIEYSNPYGVCAFMGGYFFDVPGAAAAGRWRCGYGGSCAGGGSKPLAPGSTYAQRLLLNQWFIIDHPGIYRVSASRIVRFSARADKFGMLIDSGSSSFKSDFNITVVQSEQAEVEKAFKPYIKNLSSSDFERRTEAVETITAMAPPFLEKTLIALATGEDSSAQSRAITALGRINTVESRRVLAKLIEDRQPYYSWQAIDALAETGDRTYVPLLAELAKEPAWQNLAIPALGELGGQEVISVLAPLVYYPLGPPKEPPVQSLAIRGLANTGSGEAIPHLIDALRHPLVHRDAVNALEQLTHFVIHDKTGQQALYTEDANTIRQMVDRWQRWWKSASVKAKVFGPGDCTSSPAELPEL